jgi:hypothetical protein
MHVVQDRDEWWASVNTVMEGGKYLDYLNGC